MEKRKRNVLFSIYSLVIVSFFMFSCKSTLENGIEKTETNEWITGKWKVKNADLLPFEHISFCKKLDVNSIFEFTKNGVLKVYYSKSEQEHCNQNQNFSIENNRIVVKEDDMRSDYDIISKSKSELVLKSTHIPSEMYDKNNLPEKDFQNLTQNGFKIYLVKEN